MYSTMLTSIVIGLVIFSGGFYMGVGASAFITPADTLSINLPTIESSLENPVNSLNSNPESGALSKQGKALDITPSKIKNSSAINTSKNASTIHKNASLKRAVEIECPTKGPFELTILRPDPEDCRKFYKCDKGIPIRHRCPVNLHWDDTLKVCNYPEIAECKFPSS